jgi:hypothetical protein
LNKPNHIVLPRRNAVKACRAFLLWDPTDWPDGDDCRLYLPAGNRVGFMSMRKATSCPLMPGAKDVALVAVPGGRHDEAGHQG